MSIPILKQGRCLIALIQPSVSDADWVDLHQDLGGEVRARRSKSVVLDVSGVDVLDSFATRMLRSIGMTARLAGARTVVVGIAPDVAYAMAVLGLNLDGLETALDLEEGLDRVRCRGDGARDGAG